MCSGGRPPWSTAHTGWRASRFCPVHTFCCRAKGLGGVEQTPPLENAKLLQLSLLCWGHVWWDPGLCLCKGPCRDQGEDEMNRISPAVHGIGKGTVAWHNLTAWLTTGYPPVSAGLHSWSRALCSCSALLSAHKPAWECLLELPLAVCKIDRCILSIHGSWEQHSWPAASCIPAQPIAVKGAEKSLPQLLSWVYPGFICSGPFQPADPSALGQRDEDELNASPVAPVCCEMWAGLRWESLQG